MSRHLAVIDDFVRAAYRRLAPTRVGPDMLEVTIGEQWIRLDAVPPVGHTTIELDADPDSTPLVLVLETIANVTLSVRPAGGVRRKADHLERPDKTDQGLRPRPCRSLHAPASCLVHRPHAARRHQQDRPASLGRAGPADSRNDRQPVTQR